MCLPDFKEFKQIEKNNPLVGYQVWKNKIKDSNILVSPLQDYEWKNQIEGPYEVLDSNSGIDAYNNNNNYNYYYYNNNNYNNNYYNYYYYHYHYYNYNYYYIAGIIHQYGKTAIHLIGQRSEYVKIDTLFSIRKLDAEGPKEFLDWIDIFNKRVDDIANRYQAKVISWQDFNESH
jgi:hypothetical protein